MPLCALVDRMARRLMSHLCFRDLDSVFPDWEPGMLAKRWASALRNVMAFRCVQGVQGLAQAGSSAVCYTLSGEIKDPSLYASIDRKHAMHVT